jgi:16S rRNA (cytidine1402-2'-O)-methyltransferase
VSSRPVPGTLYVVGTPIGNLEDITLRALRILAAADLIAAEDTRVTAKLLTRHEIGTRCVSLREQNASRAVPELIARLESGDDVALVSDAGTPSISDPGLDLVAAAATAGIPVSPIPGPSALGAALSVAALPGEGARFFGFLARSGPKRARQLAAIAVDPACAVIYEAPRRLSRTLEELAAACGPRRAVVLREATKLHEEIARGTLHELVSRFSAGVRGEITLVLAGADGASADEVSPERLRELVREQLATGRSTRDVAAALSSALGVPRKQVYELAVAERAATDADPHTADPHTG